MSLSSSLVCSACIQLLHVSQVCVASVCLDCSWACWVNGSKAQGGLKSVSVPTIEASSAPVLQGLPCRPCFTLFNPMRLIVDLEWTSWCLWTFSHIISCPRMLPFPIFLTSIHCSLFSCKLRARYRVPFQSISVLSNVSLKWPLPGFNYGFEYISFKAVLTLRALTFLSKLVTTKTMVVTLSSAFEILITPGHWFLTFLMLSNLLIQFVILWQPQRCNYSSCYSITIILLLD